jgi:hypothetical protein
MNQTLIFENIELNEQINVRSHVYAETFWIEVIRIPIEIDILDIIEIELSANGNSIFRWFLQFLKFDKNDAYYNFYTAKSEYINFNPPQSFKPFIKDLHGFPIHFLHWASIALIIKTIDPDKEYHLKNPCQIGYSTEYKWKTPEDRFIYALFPHRMYYKLPINWTFSFMHLWKNRTDNQATINIQPDDMPYEKLIFISDKKIQKCTFAASYHPYYSSEIPSVLHSIDFINSNKIIIEGRTIYKDINKDRLPYNLSEECYKNCLPIIKNKFYILADIIESYLFKKKYIYCIEIRPTKDHRIDRARIDQISLKDNTDFKSANIEIYMYKRNYVLLSDGSMCLRYMCSSS